MIVTIRDVERAVLIRFQISRAELLARNNTRIVSRPRQIAMYLARELTGASYPRLGQHFGRHHTTILTAWRLMGKRLAKDPVLAAEIEGCREILQRSNLWKENVARAVAERGLEARS
jgi:chromosomal replication initiator protein